MPFLLMLYKKIILNKIKIKIKTLRERSAQTLLFPWNVGS
jgi:hypothetical protein